MRRWDWVARLNQTIADAHGSTFNYGVFNCGLFAARCCDAIREQGGAEDELRTHFVDEATAKAWVQESGGIPALLTVRLGESVPWWKSQRGDLCTVMTPFDGEAVGVSTGEGIAFLSLAGVVHLKIDKALACWKVE